MAVDILKGYPDKVLENSYTPKADEGIVEGMFVKLDGNGELIKAVGVAGEYAMLAMNDQPSFFGENGGKIQVVLANGAFRSDQYKVGPSYTPNVALQVSTAGGEEGIITIHAGGASPIIGRFIRIDVIRDISMLVFYLVRE